jgi:hypothetical protein
MTSQASIEAFSLSLNQVLEITQRLEHQFDDFECQVTALENTYVRSEALVLQAELEQAHADFKEELRTKMEEFTEAFLDPAAPPTFPTTAPLKVTKLSDYDGSRDKYKTFVRELAIYLATTPLAMEHQKIMVALSFMKGGSAARWANSYLMQLTRREEEVPP